VDLETTIAGVRRRVAAWRAAGERIAFVPTMGNLHRGHLRLMEWARERAGRVVASIFVNPLQFGPGEDFERYPRTLEADAQQLRAQGIDLLFAPAEQELYPRGREGMTRVEVPSLSELLCGASRPGHFTGVATVVAKLFNIVQPDLALLGEKDYQQLLVIRRLVADLNLPVAVEGVPTVREADGLAMSSRNAYLDSAARAVAPRLYRTLCEMAERLQGGPVGYSELERWGMERLREAGFEPEYVAILRAADLDAPAPGERPLVILAAARLGAARLIDNHIVPHKK